MGHSQLVKTIAEAAQYISKPKFGLQKAKLDLTESFDQKLAALNTWFFEFERYCQIVRLNRSIDIVKLAISCLENNVHT